jgi:hypothetical protein
MIHASTFNANLVASVKLFTWHPHHGSQYTEVTQNLSRSTFFIGSLSEKDRETNVHRLDHDQMFAFEFDSYLHYQFPDF